MKTVLVVIAACLLSAGCAAGSGFKPKTVQGAQCKASCAKDMIVCSGSSYTCDRAVSTCMDSCAELDSLVEKK